MTTKRRHSFRNLVEDFDNLTVDELANRMGKLASKRKTRNKKHTMTTPNAPLSEETIAWLGNALRNCLDNQVYSTFRQLLAEHAAGKRLEAAVRKARAQWLVDLWSGSPSDQSVETYLRKCLEQAGLPLEEPKGAGDGK